MQIPGEQNLQGCLVFPWPWPFDPYSLPHFHLNPLGQMSHLPMSRPKIAAVHPSPVKERPRLDEMTVPSCRYPPIVVLLEAPNDLPEAALHHLSLIKNEK